MDRKQIIKALGEHFGVKAKYMGAPSFAYQLETEDEVYTIDKTGKITAENGQEISYEELISKKDDGQIGLAELNINTETSPNITTPNTDTEITLPLEGHTGCTLRNLINMIYSKQDLIRKSLEIDENIIEDDFCKHINEAKAETLEEFKAAVDGFEGIGYRGIRFDFDNRIIGFSFLKGEPSSEKLQAYTEFIVLLNENAKVLKHASPKAKDTDNDKFTFRVFLIRLGMVGDKYKAARKILLANLEGNSAFRNGKPDKNVPADAE